MHASLRTKVILLSMAAVLVPATVLCVLQYRSLVQLNAKTRIAVRGELIRAGQSVGQGAEAELRRFGEAVLSDFRGADAELPVSELGTRFEALRHAHPELHQIFLFSLKGADGASATFSTGEGARRYT